MNPEVISVYLNAFEGYKPQVQHSCSRENKILIYIFPGMSNNLLIKRDPGFFTSVLQEINIGKVRVDTYRALTNLAILANTCCCFTIMILTSL